MPDFLLTMADNEFYAPIEDLEDLGEMFAPHTMPGPWSSRRDGVWTYWTPTDGQVAAEGWKIHVSTRLERAQLTLDVVAAVCSDLAVPFKHLAASRFYTVLHHKHASRSQAGKFCAIYPPTEEVARTILERLSHDLAGETGPYILTDRRYGNDGVVFYRYGAFRPRTRLTIEGTRIPLVRDGNGRDVPDERLPYFSLPEGVTDPFAPEEEDDRDFLLAGRFEVTEAIRHSNGGGTYRATDTTDGSTVFIKEARSHNGLTWDGEDASSRLHREYNTLTQLHQLDPGLAPRPIAHFAEWEHEFLVTEHLPGVPLQTWFSTHGVLHQTALSVPARDSYLNRVGRILDGLRNALDRLHTVGMRFGDLSYGNVLVGADETVRLIDFETANSLSDPQIPMATFGFTPPRGMTDVDSDEYGYSALAAFLLFPLAAPLEMDPSGRLELLHRDLTINGPIPTALWGDASRHYRMLPPSTVSSPYALPTDDDLRTHPIDCLNVAVDGLADGLLSDARPKGPTWVFPPCPEGLRTNTHCLAHGTAGVLHALHRIGARVPDDIVARFRRDALTARHSLAPGLQVGLAGIAVVLAEMGLVEEANDLLDDAHSHRLLDSSVNLAHGRAGLALASLLTFQITGDEDELERAVSCADRLLDHDLPVFGSSLTTPGLDNGHAGIALLFEQLGRVTDSRRHHDAATEFIRRELAMAKATPEGLMEFRDRGDRRIILYLTLGSAGVLTALTRIAARTQDPQLLDSIERITPLCSAHSSVEPGLYSGVGSWAYGLADHADHAGGSADRDLAVRIATGITKYLVRRPGGLRALGSLDPRYHSDLATGSAGALLAIARATGRAQDILENVRATTFLGDHGRASRALVAN